MSIGGRFESVPALISGSLREVAKQGYLSGGPSRSWKRCWAFGVRAKTRYILVPGWPPFHCPTRSYLSTNFNDPLLFKPTHRFVKTETFIDPEGPVSSPPPFQPAPVCSHLPTYFSKSFFSLESDPLFPNIPFEKFLAYSFTLP